MSPLEVTRAVWTLGTGIGAITMVFLLREVMLDALAIRQAGRPGTDVLRLLADGEVWDQAIRLVSVGALFVAGLVSYLGPDWSVEVISLLCVSAGAQVFIGIIKLLRRRRLLRGLQIRRAKR